MGPQEGHPACTSTIPSAPLYTFDDMIQSGVICGKIGWLSRPKALLLLLSLSSSSNDVYIQVNYLLEVDSLWVKAKKVESSWSG